MSADQQRRQFLIHRDESRYPNGMCLDPDGPRVTERECGTSCLLPYGHDGDHEWTPDLDVPVTDSRFANLHEYLRAFDGPDSDSGTDQ